MDEKEIAVELELNNRNFVITADKKIFEKGKDGKLLKCSIRDEDVRTIDKYLKPPKSLDIL